MLLLRHARLLNACVLSTLTSGTTDLGEGRLVQETLAKVERNNAVKQQLWGLDLGLADLPSIGTPIVAGRPLSWHSSW